MHRKILGSLAVLVLVLSAAVSASAAIVDFTGGTITQLGGATAVTDGTFSLQSVDYYVENGFKLDFIGPGTLAFESIVGNYYGGTNDVIHGHWATGDFGGLTEIRVTKVGGGTFDLNYFILTSNTDTGGAAASGNERAFINASVDGTTISFSQLLPPDDWGFAGPNPQIFLGTQFDGITWFSFTVANAVDCFGMDNFFIDEPAPSVPEPGTLMLLGSGLFGLVGYRRAKRMM
jgi:hypothetical protein